MEDNDKDVQALLRRYRPAAAPADLRARCLAAVPTPGRAWPWAVRAAGLLAAIIGLTIATARLDAPVAIEPDETAHAIDAIAAVLGGDEPARRDAARVVVGDQIRRMLDEADSRPATEELR
jgi:hypothetical protein